MEQHLRKLKTFLLWQKTLRCRCFGLSQILSTRLGYEEGRVTAYGTGIKITGQAAGLSDENKVKASSLAIQSRDLPKVKELLSTVPQKSAERAPTDDQLVNLGLYIATLDGMACDLAIVKLLEEEYEAHVPNFQALVLSGKFDFNTPLCNDVMARSLPKMEDKLKAVVQINNHYVELLNSSLDAQKNVKASKYNKLLVSASQMIAEACARSTTDPICATNGSAGLIVVDLYKQILQGL